MDILKSFVIDVRIIGDDYKDKNFTGKDYCEEKGIQIYENCKSLSATLMECGLGC